MSLWINYPVSTGFLSSPQKNCAKIPLQTRSTLYTLQFIIFKHDLKCKFFKFVITPTTEGIAKEPPLKFPNENIGFV